MIATSDFTNADRQLVEQAVGKAKADRLFAALFACRGIPTASLSGIDQAREALRPFARAYGVHGVSAGGAEIWLAGDESAGPERLAVSYGDFEVAFWTFSNVWGACSD